jgi:hypothetical protein
MRVHRNTHASIMWRALRELGKPTHMHVSNKRKQQQAVVHLPRHRACNWALEFTQAYIGTLMQASAVPQAHVRTPGPASAFAADHQLCS